MAEDLLDDGDRLQRRPSSASARFVRDLDLALHQLHGRKDERGESAGETACEPEGGQGKLGVARREAGGVDQPAADALEEEEGRVFQGGADERRRDAPVETEEAVGADGLAETIERTGVAQRKVVGLGLQPDFDRVEGVFDVFAYDAGGLHVVLVLGEKFVEAGE